MKDHGGSLCTKLQSTIYKLQTFRGMSIGVSRSFGDALRHLAPSNDTKESPSVSLLMLPHLHPSEIRAEYHIPKS